MRISLTAFYMGHKNYPKVSRMQLSQRKDDGGYRRCPDGAVFDDALRESLNTLRVGCELVLVADMYRDKESGRENLIVREYKLV